MTLLLVVLDQQTCLFHRSDLPPEELQRRIQAGEWSFAAWARALPSDRPLQVSRTEDILVIPALTLAGPDPATGEPAPEVEFTPRQVQVLECLAEGLTIKQIAARMKLSPRTVDFYTAEIKEKLATRTIAQTVGRAIALGHWRARRKPG